MSFSIIEFIRTNRVIFIWTAFGCLMYMFRDLFGLVFITFVMCFLAHGVTRRLHKMARMRRRLMVAILYIVFLAIITLFFSFVVPRILNEAKSFTEQLPSSIHKVETLIDNYVAKNNTLAPFAEKLKESLTLEALVSKSWAIGKGLIERIFNYLNWFFIGTLFSFLIMLDLPNLTRSVRELRFSRLAAVYEETADSVILFAKVVGENFRAQIMVSALNTTLTAIGLYALGVGGAALLCSLVFICGLIPVLGVFISSVPILLMAINTGGISLTFWVLVMIVIIHMVEAYILNPRIVSAVMHINPVMTLMILYIAHSLIGVWGMLLGVPVSVYIYRQLVTGPSAKKKRAGQKLDLPVNDNAGQKMPDLKTNNEENSSSD